jgi:hypothetical protein
MAKILRDLNVLTARKPCSINFGPLYLKACFCCSQVDPTGKVRMSFFLVRKKGIAAMMLATIAIASVIRDVAAIEWNDSTISSVILDCNLS